MSLKVLYKPPDEILAVRIKDFLEQNGIEAILRSQQMPWYDGLAKMMRPEWGQVLVLDEDYDRAKELLKDLLAAVESPIEEDAATDHKDEDKTDEDEDRSGANEGDGT
jgi:hypothetical protein